MPEKNPLESEIAVLANIRLTEAERIGMRNLLRAHILAHPPRAQLFARLTWSISRITRGLVHTARPLVLHPIPAALILVLMLGAGTSYAAEGALPGDALYPIKTQVNERIAVAVATTPVARAQAEARRVTRRLEEAETLARAGKLSGSEQIQVETGIARAAADFDLAIAAVATDTPDALAVRNALESSYREHGHAIEESVSSEDASSESLHPVLATIRSHEERLAATRHAHDEEEEGHSTATVAATVDVSISADPSVRSANEHEDSRRGTARSESFTTATARVAGTPGETLLPTLPTLMSAHEEEHHGHDSQQDKESESHASSTATTTTQKSERDD